MKKLLKIVIVMVVSELMIFGNVAIDVVEDTIKGIRYSRADKDMIDEAERDPRFYTLKEGVKVKIEEVEEVEGEKGIILLVNDNKDIVKGIDEVIVAIDKVVNIGSKVWEMVVANRPVVNVESRFATALPKGVKNAGELSGWSKPRSYLISFYFENLYGIDVIRVSYKVTYVYGGSYGGKGKYLAGVWAIPVNIEVMWGFSFNMQAYVPDATVVNVGTSSNPIAALQLKVSWSASSLLKEIDGTGVYYIQGDGYFEEIASPFRGTRTDLKNINIE